MFFDPKRSVPHLVCALLVAASFWLCLDVARARDLTPGFETRRAEFLKRQNDKPWPDLACKSDEVEDPCVLGQINTALSVLYTALPGDTASGDRANAYLMQALARFDMGDWKRQFHWKVGALFRIVELFGAGSTSALHISSDVERGLSAKFSDWAREKCTLADATRNVWNIWGSENISAQRDGACWAIAQVFQSKLNHSDLIYADGSTVTQQAVAWHDFFVRYFRERAKAGLPVEFFSPTYSKYTLAVYYNIFEFSQDRALRDQAKAAIDFWWASWAQEQVGGIHGGSRARSYPGLVESGTPVATSAYLYFGLGSGWKEPIAFAEMTMVTSGYEPPDVVGDMAVSASTRRPYEVRTRAVGFTRAPNRDGYYFLSDDSGHILRYSYVTSSFIMSSAVNEVQAAPKLAAISSQNRWAGIVMSGDPKARVVVIPDVIGKRSSYNAIAAVQDKATMIVRRFPPPFGRNAANMRVWVGEPLARTEADGWLFLEGAAYVAIRPAWGSYAWAGNFLTAEDQNAALVIEAGAKDNFASLDAFMAHVRALEIVVDKGNVTVRQPAEGIEVTLAADFAPLVGGKPMQFNPSYVVESPFLSQRFGDDRAAIKFHDRELDLKLQ